MPMYWLATPPSARWTDLSPLLSLRFSLTVIMTLNVARRSLRQFCHSYTRLLLTTTSSWRELFSNLTWSLLDSPAPRSSHHMKLLWPQQLLCPAQCHPPFPVSHSSLEVNLRRKPQCIWMPSISLQKSRSHGLSPSALVVLSRHLY